jgi:hypothetical protein
MVHWTIPFAARTAPHPSKGHENIGTAEKQNRRDISPRHEDLFMNLVIGFAHSDDVE